MDGEAGIVVAPAFMPVLVVGAVEAGVVVVPAVVPVLVGVVLGLGEG